VKEAVTVLGRRGGIRGRELAAAPGLVPSAITRPMKAARSRAKENAEVSKLGKALGQRPRCFTGCRFRHCGEVLSGYRSRQSRL
jgi:hypothetical protein